jgi:hypothetical protein
MQEPFLLWPQQILKKKLKILFHLQDSLDIKSLVHPFETLVCQLQRCVLSVVSELCRDELAEEHERLVDPEAYPI